MSTTKVRSNEARGPAGVDMRLEVVAIPVSDADRAKEFYGSMVDERVGRDGQANPGAGT